MQVFYFLNSVNLELKFILLLSSIYITLMHPSFTLQEKLNKIKTQKPNATSHRRYALTIPKTVSNSLYTKHKHKRKKKNYVRDIVYLSSKFSASNFLFKKGVLSFKHRPCAVVISKVTVYQHDMALVRQK